jgi:hypothetical protein
MADVILAVPGREGVTYTGGEPTVQPQGLTLLSKRLRNSGLMVVCYTGYTLAALGLRAVGAPQAVAPPHCPPGRPGCRCTAAGWSSLGAAR